MRKPILFVLMTFLLFSLHTPLVIAGTESKPNPAYQVASPSNEMTTLVRPETLKTIDRITLASPETDGLVTVPTPVISNQNEHSRKYYRNDVYTENGRHHHGFFIGGGGVVLVVILLIVLI